MRGAAEKVGPAVVGLGRGWGRGSGVVIAPGQVLTVAHVLRGDEVAVTFADGDVREGRVLGADPGPRRRGDRRRHRRRAGRSPGSRRWCPPAGAPVFALANPGGRGLRTTFGLVSATGRGFRGPRGRRVAGSIEHTAPLPRGSSGGPLVDPHGQPARAQRRPARRRLHPRAAGRRGAARAGSRSWPGRGARAAAARRRARAAARGAAHARGGRAAPPRGPARPRRGRRQPGRERRSAARRPARPRRRQPLASMDDLFDALDGAGERWPSGSCAAPRSATSRVALKHFSS